MVQSGVLHFFTKKIALVQALPAGAGPPVPVDVLIIRGNPLLRMDELARCFPAPLFVFDSNNSPWRTRRWKAECQRLGIAWYDVREQGAWEMSF